MERAERESATYVTEVREVSLKNMSSVSLEDFIYVIVFHLPVAKELSLLSVTHIHIFFFLSSGVFVTSCYLFTWDRKSTQSH